MDLDEFMDELSGLEGRLVVISSTGGALYATGTLHVGGVAMKLHIPEGTFELTDEVLDSLPREPTDVVRAFRVGDSARVMLPRRHFVSAQLTENGRTYEIELEHESFTLSTFEEGPPYTPQIIELPRPA